MNASADPAPIVVKVGGRQVAPDADLPGLAEYVRTCRASGARVVVVHGGGAEIAALHQAMGIPFVKRRGLRVTPEASMPLVTMVLRGVVNTRLVAALVSAGIPALGLSGVDAGLMTSSLLNPRELGRVGGPPRISADLLVELVGQGRVPVVAPVCLGPDDLPVNVNADTVAHGLAVALGARRLDFVSDVPGVRDGEKSLVSELDSRVLQQLLDQQALGEGMIPKVQAAMAASRGGVERVRIGSLESLGSSRATEVRA